MPGLTDIYTEQFYRSRARYRAPYRAFAAVIEELLAPRSLIDIGCGAGYIVEYFAGRIPVLGVDGSPGAKAAQPPEARKRCILRDLTEPPIHILSAFECAVSIEVAEHIPAEHEDAFLAWFAHARKVLFTAAPPGQGGTGHVNEQPPEHWIERFATLGLAHDPELTGKWKSLARRKARGGCPWVTRNALVFVRSEQ